MTMSRIVAFAPVTVSPAAILTILTRYRLCHNPEGKLQFDPH